MISPKNTFIDINEFDYPLPDNRIPNKPKPVRDESKLLVYNKGELKEDIFYSLSKYLPQNAHLIFNNTKVFPARLVFQKSTGALIEIFCLEQLSSTPNSAVWKVLVGNLKRWKGELLNKSEYNLTVSLLENHGETCIVSFGWEGANNLYEILEKLAELPLPPYMNRKADEEDRIRYQTTYAQFTGSVAAPTAGLHFTERVFSDLKSKNIPSSELTLHVGAGTFKPVKVENALEHEMHSEKFTISTATIENILKNDFVIPVGTTSMRVLESLYWLGLKKELSPQDHSFQVFQNDAFQLSATISVRQSLEKLLEYTQKHHLKQISGSTSIYITPGYEFKVCKGIITNFHQPKSTLLLLISALIGGNWKKIYDFALKNDFRFLSYGDSSLLIP